MPACLPCCSDFTGEEYDDTVVNDYKYEAHKKIPQQILARTGGKSPLTVLDLGCAAQQPAAVDVPGAARLLQPATLCIPGAARGCWRGRSSQSRRHTR